MSDYNLNNLLFENGAQKRVLHYIKEENLNMKNHLSKIILKLGELNQLKKIEFFQNEFLQQDIIIELFRADRVKLFTFLNSEENIEASQKKFNSHPFIKFRQELKIFESNFFSLKYNFYSFLQS